MKENGNFYLFFSTNNLFTADVRDGGNCMPDIGSNDVTK